ncbi:hypothetical protein VTK26DRAFT_7920 [Humicola hyalothermophila]
MRFSTLQAVIGSASLLFSAQPTCAHLSHRHIHDQHARRHGHKHQHAGELTARKATCSLPDDPDLVRVPGAVNNGFAMSPDEPCEDGKWCPFACVPGKVMAQWKPNTTYTYPESMYGGLYCNGGKPEKAFKDSPYCVDGTGAVKAVNKAGEVVSFCQTVLPGNEAMIIPTDVTDSATLAVPGPSYWAGTAAHYYVNAPGIPSSKGCVWGKIDDPIGNWSPYVAGANTLANGETYVKIAWNPEFLAAPLAKTTPKFGLKIECPGGGCNGLPCAIDPSKGGVGALDSPVATSGVGGAKFCVVTVPKGKTAEIVVFNTDGPSSGGGEEDDGDKDSTPSSKPTPPPPTTTAAEPTTNKPQTSSAAQPSSSAEVEVSSVSSAAAAETPEVFIGGVFHEQDVHGDAISSYAAPPDRTPEPVVSENSQRPEAAAAIVGATNDNAGVPAERGSAMAGLVVALVAAAALL